MRIKHITRYGAWLLENNGEADTLQEIEELNSRFVTAKAEGNLNTRSVMDWFHAMLGVYDSVEYKGLIFSEMKKFLQRHYSDIYPIFSKDNRDLTKSDISEILRYKEIASQESRLENEAEARLRELGLI